jgi:hypothetical protein
MDTQMSELTRQEVLAKKRDRYARAGKEHKARILDEVVELFGYHRKAAIRALQRRSGVSAPFVRGRTAGVSHRQSGAAELRPLPRR